MNTSRPSQTAVLRLTIILTGLLGLGLRLMTERSGIDSKGLLVRGFPTWIGLLGLTALVGLFLVLTTRTLQGPAPFRASFPGSILAALGCVLAGISAFDTARQLWLEGSAPVFLAAAALAVPAFALLAVCRLLEWRPGFLFSVVICIYFALEMLRLYQTWSFDPQLHEYCFQLFACIGLTMTAYQLAAFGAGHGRHRMLWFWSLTAVFLCLVCLDSGLFYQTGAIWALTNLSCLKKPHRFLRMENDHSAE